MYREILLGLDATGLADAAIPAVAQMAAPGAEVLVIHVRGGEREPRTRDEDQRMVDDAVDRLRSAGIAAHGQVRTAPDGDVAAALVDAARLVDADLIAMGSHGRGELGGLFLGTVGHRVAARTGCAVMLVHREPGGPSRLWPDRIERILLAVDRSGHGERAIETAAELGLEHGAAIVVQHVEPVIESPASARRFVQEIVDRLRSRGLRARTAGLAGVGGVATQLAATAGRIDADLVVVGSRRRGDVGAVVLGSVTRELVQRTARPVLLAGTGARAGRQRAAGMAAASPPEEVTR